MNICGKELVLLLLFVSMCFSRDMEATEAPVYSVNAHKEIINCIDGVGGLGIGEGAPEIVTGSRDGRYSTLCLLFYLHSSTDSMICVQLKVIIYQQDCYRRMLVTTFPFVTVIC